VLTRFFRFHETFVFSFPLFFFPSCTYPWPIRTFCRHEGEALEWGRWIGVHLPVRGGAVGLWGAAYTFSLPYGNLHAMAISHHLPVASPLRIHLVSDVSMPTT